MRNDGHSATPERGKNSKQAAMAKLPEMRQEFKALRKAVGELQKAAGIPDPTSDSGGNAIQHPNRRIRPHDHNQTHRLAAAWGRYPVIVAEALRRQNYHVLHRRSRPCRPVAGRHLPDFEWLGWGRLGGCYSILPSLRRRRGHRMAGKFHKALIYQPRMWLRFRPDWKFIKRSITTSSRTKRQQGRHAAQRSPTPLAAGITFRPATDFAGIALVKTGQIAGRLLRPLNRPTSNSAGKSPSNWASMSRPKRVCKGSRGNGPRSDRRHRCLHPARANFARKANSHRGESRQAAAGHAFRCAHSLACEPANDAGSRRVLAIEGGRTILLDDEEFRKFAATHKISVVALSDSKTTEAA
jgi:hypothetical protein